ncbi:MAG: Gingipain R, partial [Bacteroidetes bacterium CG_4_10_14_3_um_filter_31_20]
FVTLSVAIFAQKVQKISLTNSTDEFTILQNEPLKFSFKTSISTIKVNEKFTKNGDFNQLFVENYVNDGEFGSPSLPTLKKLIEVPFNANIKVNIISYDEEIISLNNLGFSNKIIPQQPSVRKDQDVAQLPFHFNEQVYLTNDFIESQIAEIQNVGIMRGVNIGRLVVRPIQYNPVQNEIRILKNIVVEVNFENADITLTNTMKAKYYSPLFQNTYKMLSNYKPNTNKDAITTYPVKYVIVSHPAFQSTLQPFVQWKTKKGFKVVEAYTNNPLVGSTTTSIKNYLQGLYNAGTPSDPAPSFVLFVGDVAQIPAFAGTTGSHVTDLYYCEYTGDKIPECYYGRFSATTIGELTPQIDKTLEYEQYLMPDPSFLNEVVMIAGQDATYGPLHGDGQINYGTSTYFNPLHNLNSHTYLYAISGSSAAAIISNVSSGCSFANYTAHGSSDGWADPEFSISDISTLSNANKYPLMVGNCCLTNKFDDPVCFGEALLRASNKGALGYIGGSNSTYWDEDYWWGVGNKTVVVNPTYSATNLGSYDKTFHDHGEISADWFETQGQMISAGNLAVTQSGSSYVDYYWEIYHLMGDPSLMPYLGIPTAL